MKAAAFGQTWAQGSKTFALGAIVLILVGCEALGPTALRGGRNDYNSAINATDNQEFLLNIVRLRFSDKPYVLGISSISARSEWEASIRGQYDLKDTQGAGTANFQQYGVGGGVLYRERPTIVYQPLRGQQFVRQLLSPLDLETIFLLRFSGWEMDKILRVFARAINDVPNAPTGGDSTPVGVPKYKDFLQGINALSELEQRGTIVYALPKTRKKGSKQALAVKVLPEARRTQAFKTLTRTFKLDPRAKTYRMIIGWGPEGNKDIVVETRPILSAMYYVGRSIELPEEVLRNGVVSVNYDENNQRFDWDKVLTGLIKIRSSSTRPSNPFTAAQYRGHWYYVDDRDISSKETLTMLQIVFTLNAGGLPTKSPVLTIPVD